MNRLKVLFAALVLLLPVSAYSQFETVWLKVLENDISSVTFSHDSKWIMAWLSPNIQIFDVVTGELVNDKIPATVQQPFFSLDDTHVYGVENNRIACYNLETGLDESTALPFEKNITLFSVSKDQKYLLGATKDSNIVGFGVWDLKTGELLKYKKLYEEYDHMEIDSTDFAASCEQIELGIDNEKIYVKEYSRNRKFLGIDAKSNPVYENKYLTKLNIYDFNSLDSIGCLYYEPVSVYFGYFILSNNCQMIAFRLQDEYNGVIIYDINNMNIISKLSINGNTKMEVKFTSDGRYLVTASSAGADLWEVNTGKFIKKVEGGTLYTLDISSDDKYGASTVGEYLYLYKLSGISAVTENPDDVETLYPNPTSGMISINIILPQNSTLVATLSDNAGSILAELFNGFLNEGANTLQLDISAFASGTYYLRLSAANYSKMFKVIITK